MGRPDGPTPPPTDGSEVPAAAIELEAIPEGPMPLPTAGRVVPTAAAELVAVPEDPIPLLTAGRVVPTEATELVAVPEGPTLSLTPFPEPEETIVGREAWLETDTDSGATTVMPVIPPVAAAE